jgi:hypothetical protein
METSLDQLKLNQIRKDLLELYAPLKEVRNDQTNVDDETLLIKFRGEIINMMF